MTLIEHAKLEFSKLGLNPISDCDESPDKWLQESVLELLDVFSKQGHSGFSSSITIEQFVKLAKHQTLSPIVCSDDEWGIVSDYNEDVTYQNIRCSSIFKDGINGNPYYLDAIVFVDEDGTTFTGNALNSKNERIKSRQYINLPFNEKSFYIDAYYADDEYHIKDDNQLKSVWKYYKHQETKSYIRLTKIKNLNENR